MLDRLFKDKDGKIVIAQWPNWPIWGWLITRIAMRLTISSQLTNALNYVSVGFITVWALMETISGVNFFRRLLGLGILVFTVFGLVR